MYTSISNPRRTNTVWFRTTALRHRWQYLGCWPLHVISSNMFYNNSVAFLSVTSELSISRSPGLYLPWASDWLVATIRLLSCTKVTGYCAIACIFARKFSMTLGSLCSYLCPPQAHIHIGAIRYDGSYKSHNKLTFRVMTCEFGTATKSTARTMALRYAHERSTELFVHLIYTGPKWGLSDLNFECALLISVLYILLRLLATPQTTLACHCVPELLGSIGV